MTITPAKMSARTPIADLPLAVGPDGSVVSFIPWRGHSIHELAQQPNSHGYMRVRITYKGRRFSVFVHKLVAEAFLPPRPSPAHEICHINGVRTDNRPENIRWGTRKDNADDRERHGRTFHQSTEHARTLGYKTAAANRARRAARAEKEGA